VVPHLVEQRVGRQVADPGYPQQCDRASAQAARFERCVQREMPDRSERQLRQRVHLGVSQCGPGQRSGGRVALTHSVAALTHDCAGAIIDNDGADTDRAGAPRFPSQFETAPRRGVESVERSSRFVHRLILPDVRGASA
jgi:hypothetical protein